MNQPGAGDISNDTALVVNPAAGAGRVKRQWPKIQSEVKSRLGSIRTVFTEHEGHGISLARQLVEDGFKTIYVLGGDGTNNEVVDGIMSAGPTPGEITLGQIPFGTGGDFRRVLRDSESFKAALASLPNAPSFLCDVGRIEFVSHEGEPVTRHFLNIASCGIGGLVDQIVNTTPKWLGGKLSFYLGTVRALFGYKPTRCRLTVDGDDIGVFDITGVFVANSRYAGGGMQFAPDALVDDGVFEVVVVPDLPLWDSLLNLSAVYKGEHLRRDEVIHCQGRKVEVEPVDGTLGLLDVDGEAPGRIPATFSVVPGAIKVANLTPEVRSGV